MKRGVTSMYKNRENLLKTYTSDDEEDELDGGSQPSSPILVHKSPSTIVQGPAEWIGITTNSEEDCSYSSADNSESQLEYSENNFSEWNEYITPILNSNCAIGDRSEWLWTAAKENATKLFIRNSFRFDVWFSFLFPSQLHHLGWARCEKGRNVCAGHFIGDNKTSRSHSGCMRLRIHWSCIQSSLIISTGLLPSLWSEWRIVAKN